MLPLSDNDRFQMMVALSERKKMLGLLVAQHKKKGLHEIADQLDRDRFQTIAALRKVT